ncbi:MAG: penicillin-binding transpeptidase domain-containing protein, partial [Cyclobacteriaceae bacterium]
GTFPRDFQRKYTELLASYQLSLQLNPQQIMTHYVNQVGMNGGAGHQGVLMADQQAFGRSLSELNELEQLYLVSTLKRGTMFKTENRYVSYHEVPYHREEIKKALLKQVQNWLSSGLLSKEEANVLETQQLRFNDEPTDMSLSVSTKEFLKRQMSGSQAKGKTFTAFLTRENQELVQTAVNKFEYHFRNVIDKNGYHLYSAAMVVDIESGKILGHHGGQGLSDLTSLSVGSPTGSLIKPFILLELMEDMKNPSSLKLYDGKVKGRFTPNNYSRRYSNQMKGINEIISKSLNAPMVNVRLLRDPIELFSDVEKRFARQGIAPDQFLDLGDPEKKGEYEVNYPLGSRNMTLFDIAQLYQTLFNDGMYKELMAYDQVYDPITMKNKKIPQKSAQIYDPVVTIILKDAMHHTMLSGGTGTHILHLLPGDRKLYAKTGTSDEAIHGYTVLSDGRLLVVSYVTYGKVVGDHLELNATPPIPHGSGVRSAGILAAQIYKEFKNTVSNDPALKLISKTKN